jgi:hypothetical protein
VDVVSISRTPPPLRRPVLIAAFEGWNDAGESASSAVRALAEQLHGTAFAAIEPEEFFDFQLVRPTVRIGESGRTIDWPTNRFSWAELPGRDGQQGRHLILLEGTEPSLRWRTFTDGVVALARQLQVDLAITLGALQVDMPHTRPVRVSGTASGQELAQRHGLRPSTYEGPTGITGVLHQRLAEAGMDAVSLWAGIPHYLAGTPYLAGALVLARRALALVGTESSASAPSVHPWPELLENLEHDATTQRADIEELIAEDEDLAAYVTELEERAAEEEEPLEGPLASGEELAAEFERYLRDRER